MAGDWIRVDADFGFPGMRLRLSCRDLNLMRQWGLLCVDAENPHLYEAQLTKLIEHCRPELRGGFITSVCLRFAWLEMWFLHPSLPRTVGMATELPVDTLRPLDEGSSADLHNAMNKLEDALSTDTPSIV